MTLPPLESFFADLRNHFAAQLTAGGYAYPSDEDAWTVCALFYAASLRRIQRRPRVVYWSSELRAKSLALAEKHSLALQAIEAEALAGIDLNPRMSRSQKDAECHDDLFNDWGIKHLHLGPSSRQPGALAGGTSELLLVMDRPSAIYFIDVLSHSVFSHADRALLEIVHCNWPNLIEHARCDALQPPEIDQNSPETHAMMRKAGFMLGTTMSDGTFYVAPGGGVTLSGVKKRKRGRLSAHAVDLADNLFNRTAALHQWCKANTGKLAELIRAETGVVPKSLDEIQLRLDGRTLLLFDAATGSTLRPVCEP